MYSEHSIADEARMQKKSRQNTSWTAVSTPETDRTKGGSFLQFLLFIFGFNVCPKNWLYVYSVKPFIQRFFQKSWHICNFLFRMLVEVILVCLCRLDKGSAITSL